MENKNNQAQAPQKDDQFWENEVRYYEDALEGLKRSYAILSSLKEHALQELAKLSPEREEVQ